MIDAPQFSSLEQMDISDWLDQTKQVMTTDCWPKECIRCQDVENAGKKSIRQQSMDRHVSLLDVRKDYLVLGGVLDNVCNSACMSCNENFSTKIGSLKSKNYIKINNSAAIDNLPVERIVQMDINGGEPSASPSYLRLLENLPPNVKYLRVNTNGSRVLGALPKIIDQGIKVTVTISLDGIGKRYDYIRWPVKWTDVEKNIKVYQQMGLHELNTWTTVSALNIGDLKNIFSYVNENNLKNSWALLEKPNVLSVKYSNHFTRMADVPDELKNVVAQCEDNTVELQLWTAAQDSLRGITLWEYFK